MQDSLQSSDKLKALKLWTGNVFRDRLPCLYFSMKFVPELLREVWLLERFKRNLNLSWLRSSDFPRPCGDTVFLLGSGSSINEYSEAQWSRISREYSIGLNFWLLHDFVPNAYSVEFPYNSTCARLTAMRDVYFKLLSLRIKDYESSVIFTRSKSCLYFLCEHGNHQFFVKNNLKVTTCGHFHGSSPAQVYKYAFCVGLLSSLIRQIRSPNLPIVMPFGNIASILYLTTMCFQLGYSKIVLCGVDLKDNRYFFDTHDPKSRRELEGWPKPAILSESSEEPHLTFQRDYHWNGVNVKDVLLALQDSTFSRQGVQIYSGSPESGLRPEIPSYEW